MKQFIKSITPKAVWKILRSKRIENAVSTFEPYEITKNFGGHELTVQIADPLGLGWYGKGSERLKEIEFLSQHTLRPGAKVFDLGAHQSVVATMIAREVGDNGRVLAIEANPHNYEVSLKNLELNNTKNVDVFRAAVGSSAGELEFSDDLNGAIKNTDTSTLTFKVDSYTIDMLMEKFFVPDLIFMDIEGFEQLALEATNEAFNKNCDFFLEVHGQEMIGRFGGTVEAVYKIFKDRGYTLYVGSDDIDFAPYDGHKQFMDQRHYLAAFKSN